MTNSISKFIFGVPLLLVLLSGCAPTVNPYNNVLNSWIGVPENELISRWGPPVRVYESGGYKYLTFGGNNAVVFMRGVAVPVGCTTTMTIYQGRVSTWRYDGNC